jgi:phenylacetate-CoA ligase
MADGRIQIRWPRDEADLSRAEIDQMWDAGVAAASAYAYQCSPFYRRLFDDAGLTPEDLRCVADLRRLPLTGKRDLGNAPGVFWAVPSERVVDIATTSGTTGTPTLYPLTVEDVERLGWNEYLSFRCAGLTASDTVLLAVTMDRCFMAGMAYFEGLKRIGAATVRIGSGPPGMLLSFLDRLQPTAVVSVPTFLKKVAQYAQENKLSLTDSAVRKLICIGEPVRERDFGLNPLGQQLEILWNARVYSTYGLTELATSFCECNAGCGGHLHPSLVYVEILDEDGNPVPEGETGEIVATAFGVSAMPLLRFRTGDCSFMTHERCACGRWTPRLGPILGRKDQMMKIKGTSVYPAAVQRILDGMDEVMDYVMIVTSPSPLSDELTVMVAAKGEASAAPDRIANRFQAELKVRPTVRLTTLSEIEQLQGAHTLRKKRLLVDRRQEVSGPLCDVANSAPRVCVVLPTYNNCRTLGAVIGDVLRFVPDVVVVNDGSTDDTGAVLAPFAESGVHVVTHASNCGKGAALQSGFAHAAARGFTHAITMDTDGQHAAEDLAAFLNAIRERPDALIIGLRGLSGAGRPLHSRVLRAHSNFWVWAETGKRVRDTQSGFRAYPLRAVAEIRFTTRKYDFEIESLVKLIWRGVPVETVPVQARYGPGSESHFRPLEDFALVARLNALLFFQRLLMPGPLLNLIHAKAHLELPLRTRMGEWLRAWTLGSGVTPGVAGLSVGMGVLIGILPIWGFQMVSALVAAHLLRINKPLTVGASNISFPAAIPFILYASLLAGRLALTGTIDPSISVSTVNSTVVWHYAREYLVGAVALGGVAGIVAGTSTYAMVHAVRALHKRARV